MSKFKRRAGWVLVAIGAIVTASQVVADRPWQVLFAAGIATVVIGGLMVLEGAEKEAEWRSTSSRTRS